MKPLALTMQAFGPYASLQELDFSELKGRSFFLIHGPTGSGKTTILDAICYALYGDTSGAIRDGKTMRSDHASPDELTQVGFAFAIGVAHYRVERRPEQDRPKKSGQGVTRVKPDATIWRLTDNQEEVLATGWEAVTRYVERLLGFRSSQFRQVVLLPQGEFRRLLTANSAERQEIMQTLFKTELFQVIEEKLKAQAQELKLQYDTAVQESDWVLKESNMATGTELSAQLEADRAAVLILQKELAQADQGMKQAQVKLSQGQLLQARFDEVAAAAQVLGTLEGRVPQVSIERKELAEGLKAAALVDAERAVTILAADAERGSKEVALLTPKVAAAEAAQIEAFHKHEAEIGRELLREATVRRIQQMAELESKAVELQQAEAAVKVARNLTEQAAVNKQKTSQLLQNLQAEYSAKNGQYEIALRTAAEAGSRRAAVEMAENTIARRTVLEESRQALARVQTRAKALGETLWQTDARLTAAKQELVLLQEEWEKGQAAVLAAQLIDETACPVCGSLHHPDIAKPGGVLPDLQAIKQKQQLFEVSAAERETLRQQVAKVESERELLASKVNDLTIELKEAAAITLPELTAVLQKSREQYQHSVAAQRETELLATRLQQLAEMQQSATESMEELESGYRNAAGNLQAAEAVATDRQGCVPAQYREVQSVKAARVEAERQLSQLKAAYEQTQKEAEQAKQTVVQLQAALAAANSGLVSAGERLRAERDSLSGRVSAAGFASMTEYQNAKRPSQALQSLEHQLTLFDNQLAVARERNSRAQGDVANLPSPDMVGLQQAVEAAKTIYDATLADHTIRTGRVKQLEQWLHRLEQLQVQLKQVESRYRVFARLSEVANGRNEFGLTFQRFVLGALLDDVAIAANERLKTMSRGRYQLQRTMDRARRNSAGGLELEVFDNYTGVARPVTTLSGGETFLASLSLALGLADVVQAYAGGIHLDAIFVDEGFGTLDPEMLEFALQSLIALQQGGRMVGIISHVPELKDRIDARIEIVASAKGSKAAFKVS